MNDITKEQIDGTEKKIYQIYKLDNAWHYREFDGEFLPFAVVVLCTKEEVEYNVNVLKNKGK